ncbi:MAG: hypothetical protein R6V03_03765, partial [Kiritimatiellia bacterium]
LPAFSGTSLQACHAVGVGPALRACIHIPEEGGNEAEAVRSRFDLRTKCVTRGYRAHTDPKTPNPSRAPSRVARADSQAQAGWPGVTGSIELLK